MEGKDGRTERATAKKRRQERRKGNLCMSQEVTTVFVLFLGLVGLRFGFPYAGSLLYDLYVHVNTLPVKTNWDTALVQSWFVSGLGFLALLLLPMFVPTLIGGVVSSLMQTGPFLSFDTLEPKWSQLNPVQGMKRLFSPSSLVKAAFSIMKILLICFVLYLMLRSKLMELTFLHKLSVQETVSWTFRLIFRMMLVVTILFISIAVLDWCYRKYKYERDMMMTKKEVEDERKNEELPGIVRGAQRRKMRELSMLRMMAAVPNASVVITNPTHVAVALQYDPSGMAAPKVVAKGVRLVAQRIKEIAKEHNIPIVERPPLARDLYKNVKVGREVPSRFYGAIAEILAYLYRLGSGRIREMLAAQQTASGRSS